MPNVFIGGTSVGGCNDGSPGLLPLMAQPGALDSLLPKKRKKLQAPKFSLPSFPSIKFPANPFAKKAEKHQDAPAAPKKAEKTVEAKLAPEPVVVEAEVVKVRIIEKKTKTKKLFIQVSKDQTLSWSPDDYRRG